MASRILIFPLLFATTMSFAQVIDITTLGVGSTPREAETVALRSALEQCFGVFLSSKSELTETSLTVNGETEHAISLFENITTITSGEIVSYEVIEQTEESIDRQPSRFHVLVKSRVSVEAVADYARSKGVEVQLAGGMFAQNIKLRQLNEEAEITALANLVDQVALMLNNCVDFEVQYSDPTEHVDGLWLLRLATFSKWNQNFEECLDFIASSLNQIACSEQEAQERKSGNESHYNLQIVKDGNQNDLTFRSAEGIYSLGDLLLLLRMATMNFEIAAGAKSIDGLTAWDNCLYQGDVGGSAFNGTYASCNSGLIGSVKQGYSNKVYDEDYPLVCFAKSLPLGSNRIPRESPTWPQKPESTIYSMSYASKYVRQGFSYWWIGPGNSEVRLSEIKKYKGNLTQSVGSVFGALLDDTKCSMRDANDPFGMVRQEGVRWDFDELAKNSVHSRAHNPRSGHVDPAAIFDACFVFEFPLFFTLEELGQIQSIEISPARLLE